MVGDLTAGVLLSQIVFWHLPDKKGDTKIRVSRDGLPWVAKLHSDWWGECRVTVRQAERAIKQMVGLGIVETRVYKFDGNPTVHIRIVQDKFLERLRAVLEGEIRPDSKGKPRGRHAHPTSKGDEGKEESQKQEERDPFSNDDGDEAGKRSHKLEDAFPQISGNQPTDMREPIHESVGTYTESTSEITSKTTAQTTAGASAPVLTLVQGGNGEDVVVADSKSSDQDEEIQDMLMMEGITQDAAISLSKRYSADQIKRQIAWMPRRTVTGSRPGYLRRAIEQDYSAPAGVSSTGASPKAGESPRVAQKEVRAMPSSQHQYVPPAAPERPVLGLEATLAEIAAHPADVREAARRHIKETNKFEWKREYDAKKPLLGCQRAILAACREIVAQGQVAVPEAA